MLLSRNEFRNKVFERDGHRCVICGAKAGEQGSEMDIVRLDAHHIIERRLWSDGGYYLDNGATLCSFKSFFGSPGGCHIKAETTEISVEDIRIAAKIEKIVLPEDMYVDHVYDKWGNVILSNGKRTKGPLFYDESVQKILSYHPDFDTMFVEYVKYPRTYHLTWSPGKTEDDRTFQDLSVFEGKRVIVTRKMDGENFSGYRDYCHARSVDGRSHYTRDWAKNFWMQRSYELPEGWRVCAENLYAVHSIKYEDLPGYLLGFSIWNEKNECLSWDDTIEWFALLDMPIVPVIYDGIWNEEAIKKLYNEKTDREFHEGYVVRLADSFEYKNFKTSVAKYVRANHVATQKHWMYGAGRQHDVNLLNVG
jgi:hypothetical protein